MSIDPINNITLKDMIECVDRELQARWKVYPGLVCDGKMEAEVCDNELLTMEAVRRALIFFKMASDQMEAENSIKH
jgi:hypothetical protein